jgi:hypothetical protein
MKKTDSEREIRALCHTWRKDNGFAGVPPYKLISSDFYAWLVQYHAAYLEFPAKPTVKYVVEHWFDQEFGRAGL